uniref:hypothetical protein n=1 Tax=Rahnella sp. RFA10(1/100) TaxID=2511202 RepID=UPI0010228622|nr:hypothetical protein [Rahnella sp. RFA10(1/100)]
MDASRSTSPSRMTSKFWRQSGIDDIPIDRCNVAPGIRLLKKTDIFENRLRVIQGKTGEQLAIQLPLCLAAYDMTPGEVNERCLQNNNTEFILSSASRKTGRHPGALRADIITQAFWRVVINQMVKKRPNTIPLSAKFKFILLKSNR